MISLNQPECNTEFQVHFTEDELVVRLSASYSIIQEYSILCCNSRRFSQTYLDVSFF
jgi:hypothetical protein